MIPIVTRDASVLLDQALEAVAGYRSITYGNPPTITILARTYLPEFVVSVWLNGSPLRSEAETLPDAIAGLIRLLPEPQDND